MISIPAEFLDIAVSAIIGLQVWVLLSVIKLQRRVDRITGRLDAWKLQFDTELQRRLP